MTMNLNILDAIFNPYSGSFEKLHVPIDLHGGEHEKEFERLTAQRKVIEAQVTKYPLLAQALKEGWGEIRMHSGELGFHFNSQRAISGIGETTVEKNRESDNASHLVGNHFSVADHRSRQSLAKAMDSPIDGADLRDSAGF